MTVIPHYDSWSTDKRQRTVKLASADLAVVGLDECTALLRDGERWRVAGAGGAVVFRDGHEIAIDDL